MKYKIVILLCILACIANVTIGCTSDTHDNIEASYELSQEQIKNISEKGDVLKKFIANIVTADSNEDIDEYLQIIKPYLTEEAYIQCERSSYKAREENKTNYKKRIDNVSISYKEDGETETYTLTMDYIDRDNGSKALVIRFIAKVKEKINKIEVVS